MPRVYHKGAVWIALPMADPEIGTVFRRPLDPLSFDPADAGKHIRIMIMLAREGL